MNLLEQAAIFLVTAVIVVPLFRRMQLGAVLGYLAAGAIIGPWGLGLIADADATLNFAEMGVVLLLFLIGLELEPSRLWALRHPVFGLGGAQVVVTGIALTGIAVWLNLSWQAALVVGLGLAMSSTAIVLAWLGERGQDRPREWMDTRCERCSGDRVRHCGQPTPGSSGAEARRTLRRPRSVHRRRIAGRHRSGPDDGSYRHLDVAGRVPCGRAARRFGIPSR